VGVRRLLGRMTGHRIGAGLSLPTSGVGQVVAVVTVLAVAAGIGVGTAVGAPTVLASLSLAANPRSIAPLPEPVTPQPALRALGSGAPAPTEAGLAAAIDGLAAAPALGSLAGVVIDAASTNALWERDPGAALVPGSTAKLVTAAAALLALDPAARLRTTVVAGAEPGTVVLVGGGDPTLSALPAGNESVYPGAPRLDDLVAQVKAAVPGVDTVLVDVSRYEGDVLGPGWFAADVPAGYIAPIVPVMLDGGRGVPTQQDTPRSGTPALTAAGELARRLGANPATVAVGTAPPQATVLGTVSSQPVRELVGHTLQYSDNVLAEILAREVALATGAEPTFDGAAEAMRAVLTTAGIDIAGLDLVDGSGLSARNKVTAQGLATVLSTAAAPGIEAAARRPAGGRRHRHPGPPVRRRRRADRPRVRPRQDRHPGQRQLAGRDRARRRRTPAGVRPAVQRHGVVHDRAPRAGRDRGGAGRLRLSPVSCRL